MVRTVPCRGCSLPLDRAWRTRCSGSCGRSLGRGPGCAHRVRLRLSWNLSALEGAAAFSVCCSVVCKTQVAQSLLFLVHASDWPAGPSLCFLLKQLRIYLLLLPLLTLQVLGTAVACLHPPLLHIHRHFLQPLSM